ncbi:MAG: REDY-like protein HapK [Alphaproteobacteria bacterium]|nr:MAG: REDY-like protein HapK [Alphaproteobacteria bacterium]
MRQKIIVLFNLKKNVTVEDYEKWARTVDMPTVRSLKSVNNFDILRCTGMLMSEDAPPYQYIEIIDVNDMEQFGADVSSPKIQEVAKQFGDIAEAPLFILTEILEN